MNAWGFGPGLNAAPPWGNGHKPVEMQSEALQEQKEVELMRNASKRMGKKGTLTIPQHLRHELGLQGGTAVDLTYGGRRAGDREAPPHLQYLPGHL